MKICKIHWQMMQDAVKAKGMWALVAPNGKVAADRMVEELETGQSDPKQFDPLMSMHWHFSNEALRAGGLYLMSECDNQENDNQYCPVCEFVTHSKGFDAKSRIEQVADDMASWCREEKLIPQIQ